MENEQQMIKAFMPVTKMADGKFVGILSDDSMDRDEEFMSKELLESWAENKTLKALANHENKMQSWIGGWRNLKTISKNGHTALVAEPWFFSKEANPLADQIKKQAEEAIANGESPGISIGAIPKESIKKEIEGKNYRIFTKGELVEATWVPIQSNRNATFGHVAKAFDFNKDDEAAEITKSTEENKMSDEIVKDEDVPTEEVEESKDEAVSEDVKDSEEEVAEEPAKEEPESKPVDEKMEELMAENKQLKSELDKLKKHSVLKATVEQPASVLEKENELNKELTVEEMLRLKLFGGK